MKIMVLQKVPQKKYIKSYINPLNRKTSYKFLKFISDIVKRLVIIKVAHTKIKNTNALFPATFIPLFTIIADTKHTQNASSNAGVLGRAVAPIICVNIFSDKHPYTTASSIKIIENAIKNGFLNSTATVSYMLLVCRNFRIYANNAIGKTPPSADAKKHSGAYPPDRISPYVTVRFPHKKTHSRLTACVTFSLSLPIKSHLT